MPGRPAPGVFGVKAFGVTGFGAGAFGVAGLGLGAFGEVRTWVAADAPRGLAAGAAGRATGSRSESTRVPWGGVSRPTGAAGALRKPAPGAAGNPEAPRPGWGRPAFIFGPWGPGGVCGPEPSRRDGAKPGARSAAGE